MPAEFLENILSARQEAVLGMAVHLFSCWNCVTKQPKGQIHWAENSWVLVSQNTFSNAFLMNASTTTTKALKEDKQAPKKSYVNTAGFFNHLFTDSVRILNSFGQFSESDLHRYFVLFPILLLKITQKINLIDNITILCSLVYFRRWNLIVAKPVRLLKSIFSYQFQC